MTNPLKVNAYMKAIPPGNKNPEKPKLLEYFIEGVSKVGDKGQIINTFQYEPADVGILQGYVHPGSKHVPHLNLRRQVLEGQKALNRRTIIADANLFLAYDPGNKNTYLRYSSGEYILITCQRDNGWSMDGMAVINWLHLVLQNIKRFTDRPIMVRFHPGDKHHHKHMMQLRAIGHKVRYSSPSVSLLKDLHDAWCVISYNSSPGVVSAVEGVPVFVLDPARSQASEVANTDLRNIENPNREFDREQWLRRLAMSHWRLDELRNGDCWRHMREWSWAT